MNVLRKWIIGMDDNPHPVERSQAEIRAEKKRLDMKIAGLVGELEAFSLWVLQLVQ